MQATMGDQIKVRGHRTGQPDRGGEVSSREAGGNIVNGAAGSL